MGRVPEVFTLVVVAVVGVLVGAVGVAAFRLSEHQWKRELTVDVEPETLSVETLAVLNAIPGIVIVIDSANTVVRADAAAYAKGLVRGNDVTHEALATQIARARDLGRTMTEDLQLPRSQVAGAALVDFSVRVAPLPRGSVLILAEDQTFQRRSATARRDFTANVSHELKTPVGAIRLLAETIQENPGDEEAVAHFARSLTRESERLSALVQDIIDLSRLQGPDTLDSAELVDIDQVVSSALALQTTTADNAGVELMGPALPVDVKTWGNQEMLVTAVRNLVDNAVRYSAPGSRVSIGASCEDDLVHISVVDTGEGISDADQQRIFERFYRVDPARSRNTGGTGLGLAIVKHVAADHGGTVTVWSRPGSGSTFTLVLPIADTGGPGAWLRDPQDEGDVDVEAEDSDDFDDFDEDLAEENSPTWSDKGTMNP